MSSDNSRVVVVTGGNSGIGRGIALYFGARGWRVAIIGRNAETLRETKEAVGDNCLSFQADVAQREEVFAAVHGVHEAWGRIDVAINNAGAATTVFTHTEIEKGEARFRQTLDVHVMGAYFLAMAAIPHLTRPGGRIINVSSIGAFSGGGSPGGMAYVAAKAALNALTMSWALELGPQGITVNGIAPGFIETALTDRWPQAMRDACVADTVVGRSGKPEDIAATAFYLASPEASFITGEVVNVNGGALFVH